LSYLSRPPCPRMRNLKERFDNILNKIETRGVNGTILFPTKYCDSFFYDLPLLRSALKEKGIPFLILEQDYSQRPLEQLKTRIEVLLEKHEHR
ncbi:MAG: 2-hydroxyacyl-CoA dehydratase, partial [bacterium]